MKNLLRTIAATAVLAAMPLAASAEEMVFASWGGAYQDAIRKAWIEPFTAATGVEVIEDTEPEVARIRGMVDTGNVEWDVVTGGNATLSDGMAHGLFEKITPEMVNQEGVIREARSDYGVPSEIFSTVIGYSTEAFPNGGPKTFADFWDVEKFPGKRAMPDKPSTVLEAALLADGVAPADVYKTLDTEEGMKRALDKISALKPSISIWWNSGAQPVQAIGSGEVVMALGWNGRFQAGVDEGLPLAMSWDQSIAQVGYFMIVKGAPNKDAAVKFLNFIIDAKNQAEFSKYVAYGPVTEAALPLIDDERKARLPSTTERLANTLFLDIPWWGKNAVSAGEAYTMMMQQ
ncbi:ABC transporter substrate-binding protein [Paracoccus suum]|uniref:ABC transporter substrate-binding protein n=1 Tax=Paracoccus suum TaxID=2259340 RepID=A0A344PMA9_9RHOB|nr:ABC transporter substrate-binding protein [Paracoccus suum]AXC50514.1 ABC transporter substrate-binding protein [Paracoccus suum]